VLTLYFVLPVFHRFELNLQQAFSQFLAARYGLDLPVVIEQPKQPEFGELAVPLAFQLARQLRQAPKKIAAELIEGIGSIDGVAAMEIAGNGYINIRLDRGAYGQALLRAEPETSAGAGGKIVVEHTNINPNKAAHIGHLRNAVLGDTFVRMLRSRGRNVEVQNYIDNTGVQVADVVAGFHFLERKTPSEVRELAARAEPRFDYVCWDLYARTAQHLNQNPDLGWRSETLHAIEAGHGELAEMGAVVAGAIVEHHLDTMLRLGIEYDVLPRESEILHLQFWAAAFEQLRHTGAVHLETQGKNAGCWVMPAAAFSAGSEVDDSKVIVRSNGTVTYVGKDIAYQLWKFGLLGKDFYYRPLRQYPDGHRVWQSTDQPQVEPAPAFGNAVRVYNVIDARQSYLQDVVVAGLKALGAVRQAEASIHFSYEMVALSPRCCADLGIELSEEDRRRPYIEVSGRKGLGVKADDLIDQLIATALREVDSRHPEDPEQTRRRVATQIAVGALRYFLLKFTRPTVIAFDFQEALSFEGETGPYVQYAAVRARSIGRKLEARGATLPDFANELTREALARQLQAEDFWQMLLAASKADSAIERAVAAGEPANVSRYAFTLAQAFNNFYHQYPILSETDREKKVFLLWMTDFFRAQLERVLGVLGIEVPEFM